MTNGAFLDRAEPPAPAAFAGSVGGRRHLWHRLTTAMANTYGSTGEALFYGRDSGWVLRFRRSGRTLLVLLPEPDAFRALVVIGPSIAPSIAESPLTPAARRAFEEAHAYPDGRWLWIDVADEATADVVMRLVELKSPPPRRVRRPVPASAPSGGVG